LLESSTRRHAAITGKALRRTMQGNKTAAGKPENDPAT
jgi:hypothetical protein